MSVLVVGAGPTGLTAAVELARRGVPLRIVDRREGASGLSRAVGILDSTMEILAPSGVAEAIRAEAVRIGGVVFHAGARPLARLPLNVDDRSQIYGLPQDRTEAHLAEALARYGVHVNYGCPLVTLTQDADGVTVRIGGETAHFDRVIGADGVHSAVRPALGLPFDGHDLLEDWSIADVIARDWPDPDWFQMFDLPAGKFAVVVPLAPRRFRVIASAPDALAALPVPMQVEKVRTAGRFRISVRQVPRYTVGRVHLAGDAAHCHSPVGGRGMNLGIADAAELAARIARDDLAGYSDARHAAGTAVLRLSERGRRILQSRNPAVRLGFRTLLPLIAGVPPLARVAMRRIAGA